MNGQEPCLPSTTKASAFKQGNGSKAGSIGYEEEKSPTLSAVASGTNQVPAVMSVDVYNQHIDGEIASSLTTVAGGSNTSGPKVLAVDCRNGREQEINGTLQAKGRGGTSYNLNHVVRETSV